LAAVIVFAVFGLVAGERRVLLTAAACACLLGEVAGVLRQSSALIDEDYRRGALAVSERVRQLNALAPVPAPADWDTDLYRKPRGALNSDGSIDEARIAS